jgi:hypothetical protein
MAFVTFGGLIFEFLTPFILGGHNLFTFILFLMIFRAQTQKTMERSPSI